MKLSILLSGIRINNWIELYDSIASSYTKKDWELIIVSPYELPKELNNISNIQWIQDWGSPCRCQQIALTMAKGEYINWASDDGEFTHGSMDRALDLLSGENWRYDYKTIIVGKYLEGDNYSSDMKNDSYYILNNHLGSACRYLPLNTPMINLGLVSRKLLIEMGGWDSLNFEVLPIAYNDFSVRCNNNNCKFIHQQEIMFTCSHEPGTTGTHGPIHKAQTFRDEPMFKLIYNRPESKERINIDINNWNKSPIRWERRFGKSIETI